MANDMFNVARGFVGYYAGLPAANDALIVVLLKSAGLVSDDALADYDTLAALLAGASDEADFTNYSRKTLASVTNTVDDTNNRRDVDAADFTYTAAGGASNNTIAKAVICYDPDTTGGTDADIIPLTHHDLAFTTDGTDQAVTIPTGGFYRSGA